MAFRFNLETLLRLRRSLERKEELRLQVLWAGQTAIESSVQRTKEMQGTLRQELLRAAAKSALPAGEIRLVARQIESCELVFARLRDELAAAREEVRQGTAVLIEHSRRRKLLECLRQQQGQRHVAETERRAQAELEQIHLVLRHGSGADKTVQASDDTAS